MTAPTTPRRSKRLMAGSALPALAIIAAAALAFGPGGDDQATANPSVPQWGVAAMVLLKRSPMAARLAGGRG